MIKNFINLEIWKRSRILVKKIYNLTNELPKEEQYGLINQIQRAAVSVPSNIAEGCGRKYKKELVRFLHFSIGSLCEVETQLYLIMDLEYANKEYVMKLINEVIEIRKMIQGFIRSLD